ncbi:MAG: glycine cleavage system protein GcvH [Pirellulaceae bacterium]
MKPEDLLFAETHEWAFISEENGAKVATVGISAFALEQLTDLVYMELPEVGTTVAAGEEFGEVESVKAVSPLYSPVAGEVIAVNTALPDHLEELSASPYQNGWIAKIRISDERSLSKLLDHAAYQKQCESDD